MLRNIPVLLIAVLCSFAVIATSDSGLAKALDELHIFNHANQSCIVNDRADLAPQLLLRHVYRSRKSRLERDVTITTHLTVERYAQLVDRCNYPPAQFTAQQYLITRVAEHVTFLL